ncbi:hypothetical protein [Streptomyces natalensis]|uniref:Uncharacterized protein n=1 Tax=Streptomyces natalensis ATCC 27448 TaxID=1240678 RepID=A0A0D7CL07_9ACTN|nr:hypothetical protein [Streptomyces natalensis]KIZ16899.1 hypothetical protein SNA_18165 [Streptomyces natalensis ATCC 27448]
MPETEGIPVAAVINLPLDDGGTMRVRQTIHAQLTETAGLVVFPLLLGPLAVEKDWWSVTHAPSGKRIPISFRSPEAATAFANAAGPLVDWITDRPRVQKQAVLDLAHEHDGYTDEQYMAAQRKAAA